MNMSAPGNTTKLGTALINIQTAESCLFLDGIEPTMHYSAYYWVSALSHYASQMNCIIISYLLITSLAWLNWSKITKYSPEVQMKQLIAFTHDSPFWLTVSHILWLYQNKVKMYCIRQMRISHLIYDTVAGKLIKCSRKLHWEY